MRVFTYLQYKEKTSEKLLQQVATKKITTTSSN